MSGKDSHIDYYKRLSQLHAWTFYRHECTTNANDKKDITITTDEKKVREKQ